MSKPVSRLNQVTFDILGCCYRIHTDLGPGLFESVYELCLEMELLELGYKVARQVAIPIVYKDVKLEGGFRADLIVEDAIIIEVKSIESLAPVHQAQVLTYMKLAHKPLGLLLNFNVASMKNGIKRFIIS